MTADPVLARRARVARLATHGRRLGAGLFALAALLVVAGLAWRFTSVLATAATAALVVGSAVLAPAIVAGFAVRAAEREERGGGPAERPH